MNDHNCSRIAEWLGAYVDDELPGAERMVVSEHLATCVGCAGDEADIRGVGQALRTRAASQPFSAGILAGLAGGVTSRIYAEDEQSWRATWNRAFDDWHWVAVGVGSVSAALVSFVLASLMVYSSIAQLSRMNAPAGMLSLMTLPQGRPGQPVLMLYEGALGSEGSRARPTMPASFGWAAERALVAELEAVLRRSGRPASLAEMSTEDRLEVVALMAEINRFRFQEPNQRPGGMTQVIGVHLETTTSVTGDGI
ncbi:MAG: zf-HC2 domain-containing protein [Acidobacteria bacterium]|nr:zf-HC2 domain-containing protein [Acidobacteriota bacterium]